MRTLRSGKLYDNGVQNPPEEELQPPTEQEKESAKESEAEAEKEKEKEAEADRKSSLNHASQPYVSPIPYPQRLQKEKRDRQFSDLYSMLSKVEINLPLLEVISNVPAYAKFFKELCSKKKKLLSPEKLFATEVANSVLQQSLPPKLKDPGSFIINITIGNKQQVKAMLDLGSSINLMPFSLYKQLELGELKATRMSL